MGTRKDFFDLYRQFRHAPSKILASSVLSQPTQSACRW